MAFGDEHPEQPIGRNNKRITTVLLAAMVAVGGGLGAKAFVERYVDQPAPEQTPKINLYTPPDTARRTFKTGYAAAPQPEPVKPEPAPAPIQPLTLVQAIAPKPAAPAATAAAAPPKPLLPGFVGQMAPEVPNRTSPAAAPIPSGGQSVDYRPGTSDGRDRLDEDAVQGLSATKNRWLVGAGTQGQDFVTAPFSPPISSTMIQAGTIIPAITQTAINSDLPGDVVAMIQVPVCDTPTGERMLIPPSTRLYGRYADQLAFAQGRAQVAWIRILFPDGSSQNIGAMPGTDASGASGIEGEVDTHPWGMAGAIGGAALFSIVGQTGQLVSATEGGGGTTNVGILGAGASGRATPPRASARK
ncbi:MAG: TrbI/VirB10 family protein [Rhodospirillales bacterium]|nr:TrbI/VirB10 family protein [Rhodospirillales bacterium]